MEDIMVITATELKANIGQYLNAVSEDAVYITRNGKVVAKLSSPAQDKQAILDSLVGITAENPVSLEEARKERLSRK
jgi:prevent-host-death family protein